MILTDIVNPAIIILNAGTVFGTVADTKKFPAGFLDALALDASDEVCHYICAAQGHPLRNTFLQVTGALADEATVALAGYQVYDVVNVKVDGVPAHRAPWTYIDRMRTDGLGRTKIDKMYDLREQIIKHNGTSAVCNVIAFKKLATPQTPDGLLNAVISGLLKMASSKMGVNTDAAGYFAQQSNMHLSAIMSGAISVPSVTAYNKMDERAA